MSHIFCSTFRHNMNNATQYKKYTDDTEKNIYKYITPQGIISLDVTRLLQPSTTHYVVRGPLGSVINMFRSRTLTLALQGYPKPTSPEFDPLFFFAPPPCRPARHP